MSSGANVPTMGLRERTREAVRAQIADAALVLFDERGFDQTTIDDIAGAVGLSSRSFFRYFAVKEDVVTGDPRPTGRLVRDALLARPAGEPLWDALRASFSSMIDTAAIDPASALRTMRVMMSTPTLRARHLEKHIAWAVLLVPAVEERLAADDPRRSMRAQAIVNAALACFDVALAEWTAGGAEEPVEDLLDACFATFSLGV